MELSEPEDEEQHVRQLLPDLILLPVKSLLHLLPALEPEMLGEFTGLDEDAKRELLRIVILIPVTLLAELPDLLLQFLHRGVLIHRLALVWWPDVFLSLAVISGTGSIFPGFLYNLLSLLDKFPGLLKSFPKLQQFGRFQRFHAVEGFHRFQPFQRSENSEERKGENDVQPPVLQEGDVPFVKPEIHRQFADKVENQEVLSADV